MKHFHTITPRCAENDVDEVCNASVRLSVCLSTTLSDRYWSLYPARQPRDSVTRLILFLDSRIALCNAASQQKTLHACRRSHVVRTPLSSPQLSDRHAKSPSQIYRCGHDCPSLEAEGK
jgi:hypothetical protein